MPELNKNLGLKKSLNLDTSPRKGLKNAQRTMMPMIKTSKSLITDRAPMPPIVNHVSQTPAPSGPNAPGGKSGINPFNSLDRSPVRPTIASIREMEYKDQRRF